MGGRRLHKAFLLSLNMILPQKCYVPAAKVIVHYADGSLAETSLTPPVNFDAFHQDFAVNTLAFPLDTLPAGWCAGWLPPDVKPTWKGFPWFFGQDQSQIHLTMTDVICDPAKSVQSIEIRSIATETFIGLASITVAEVE